MKSGHTTGSRQTSTVGANRAHRTGDCIGSGRMDTSGCGGTGEDVTEGHARDDMSGETGGQMRGHDQGLPAHGTGMRLKPCVGVDGRVVVRHVENGWRLTVDQEGATAGKVRLLRTGNEPVVPLCH